MKTSNKKLKIAQIAPLIERVPPKKYGGTERVVFALTEELVRKGHDVTLFATGDSKTSAKLHSIFPKALREAKLNEIYGLNVPTLLNLGIAYQMQDEFDIIHDHNSYVSLPAANLTKTPVVITLHGALKTHTKQIYEKLNKPYLVTISKSQSKTAPDLNYIATIYNGINMNDYPFSDKHDGYLLFAGRISMEKGTHYAIEAAQCLNMPLIIAAKLESVDHQYFENFVEPKLSEEHIHWIGEVTEDERNKLMSRAFCTLHPVTWREPFGLTMIEAMACGSPVVAFNKGSIPEVVMHGKTGFVVEDVEEMVNAIENIKNIDRNECRSHALENFNAEKMADEYEEVYYKILQLNQ